MAFFTDSDTFELPLPYQIYFLVNSESILPEFPYYSSENFVLISSILYSVLLYSLDVSESITKLPTSLSQWMYSCLILVLIPKNSQYSVMYATQIHFDEIYAKISYYSFLSKN